MCVAEKLEIKDTVRYAIFNGVIYSCFCNNYYVCT